MKKNKKRLSKKEFVRRCCEMMEIDKATTLTYYGVVDLLQNIHDEFIDNKLQKLKIKHIVTDREFKDLKKRTSRIMRKLGKARVWKP